MQEFKTTDFVRLEIEEDTDGLTNLIVNPDGELGGWGWITPLSSSRIFRAETGNTGSERPFLAYVRTVAGASYFYSEPFAVIAGHYVDALATVMIVTPSGGGGLISSTRAVFEFLNAADAVISTSASSGSVNGQGTMTMPTVLVPAGAVNARLRFNVFKADLVTNPTGPHGIGLRAVTVAQAATAAELAGLTPLPAVNYFNVLPESHSISVARDGLNVGRLTATILSSTLDPSQSTLIRPGRRARLSCLVEEEWETLIGGKLLEADVSYEVKDPRVPAEKRARIQVVIVDPTQTLANTGRPEGVATIDELPFVLEGAGVPWSVNGSGNQVTTADVTAYSDSAKALDQVALTRDTALGFAWMSRVGVMTVWDRDQIPTGSPVQLVESNYSDLDLSFSSKDAINEVQITVQALGADGATAETVYGPFTDPASIKEWGRYRKEFTVTGLDSAQVEALADTVLAANVTPRIRVNSLTIPIATVGGIEAHALRDLYDEVNVVLDALDIDDTLRVTGVEHTINTGKWLLKLTFSEEGGVAQPTTQPPIQSGARPDVGVVELFAGDVSKIPATKLLCNGASYAVADYPHLFAIIGYTYGGAGAFFEVPDLTDRFPIGSGTKALGTTGGAASVVLTAANLPPHVHPIARRAGAAGSGDVAIGNATAASQGGTAANVTANTAVDILNPWLSLNFVIRAA